jgi:hypothetical protein
MQKPLHDVAARRRPCEGRDAGRREAGVVEELAEDEDGVAEQAAGGLVEEEEGETDTDRGWGSQRRWEREGEVEGSRVEGAADEDEEGEPPCGDLEGGGEEGAESMLDEEWGIKEVVKEEGHEGFVVEACVLRRWGTMSILLIQADV